MRCCALILAVVALAAGEAAAPLTVTVALDGRALDVDGQVEVPRGLFGVHAVAMTPELVADLGIECSRNINFLPSGGSRYLDKAGELPELYRPIPVLIDCQGDRFCLPPLLKEADFANRFAAMGAAYGQLWKGQTAKSGRRGIVQFWNEAYLNWAERSAGENGSTIRNDTYDLTKAVEGGPVTITGWDKPLTHFRWRGLWPVRVVEEKDKKGNPVMRKSVGWSVPLPAGAKPGDTFKAAETRYWRQPGVVKEWTVEQVWYPVDPTATGYWSGRQNLDFYGWMFAPWAKGLRAANPDVTILAGWDFNYEAGGWSVWTELYRPLLQQFGPLIDGLTEHHYGIPPQRVQAWYEVGSADAWAISGRRLRTWNTECQGRLDPAVHGASTNSPGTDGGIDQKRWEASYNSADIIGLIARMPDKAASRTIHNFAGTAFPDCGGAWTLRLLKPLRGRLLHVSTDDQGCWAAAAETATGTVLAIYNQRAGTMAIDLDAVLPGGRATAANVRRLVVDATTTSLRIDAQPLALAEGRGRIELASRDAVVVQFTGPAGAATRVWTRRQFFPAEGALRRVAVGETLTATITLPEAALRGAAASVLRVVIEDCPTGVLGLKFNGVAVAIRRDLPVTDVVLPVGALNAGSNRLEFTSAEPFLMATCSVLVEAPAD